MGDLLSESRLRWSVKQEVRYRCVIGFCNVWNNGFRCVNNCGVDMG